MHSFWNFCKSLKKQIVIAGESDSNNRAPAHWHWGTINEVMDASKLHIPRINSGFAFWKRTTNFFQTIQPYLDNPSKYKIKPWFRGNVVDEIFIAIYLGIHSIRPETDEDAQPPNPKSIQTYRNSFHPYGDAQFFHCFNKETLPQYFDLFRTRNLIP